MDISCPRCQTTKYRNPKMKLKVSTCGHSLCENCVDNQFSKGIGNCPTCKTELKKDSFREQTFEDPYMHFETNIRKRLLHDFNRQEQDFTSLDAYNDYLEMLETYIFNLTNKIDVEETERKIAQYKDSNKDLISKNRGKLSKDAMYIERMMTEEQNTEKTRRQIHDREIQEEQEAKKRVKDDMMQALLSTDGNVDQVLKRSIQDLEAKRDEKAQPIMPNMIRQEQEILLSLANDPKPPRLYEYVPSQYDHQGPRIPDKSDLEQMGYLNHVRQETPDERACGYTREYPCMRAVQEAFDMLLFVKEPSLSTVKKEIKDEPEEMETMSVNPPSNLKGMTQLDRDQFTQTITVPYVNIPVQCIQSSKWKDVLLLLSSFKNVRDLEPALKTHKQVLFNPELIQTKEDLIERIPSIKDYVEQSFDFTSVTVTYNNYSIEQVIKAILPDDLRDEKRVNNGSGYSLVGHIAHFNLRDEVLPYKHIIAQVILDKLPHVKTVVNKLHEIDSVYRNFELEIIAGDANTVVQCRESKAIFQLDFAKVYWNPRLSTEHERIVDLLDPQDLVFDVCAGVGPFVVPASMLGCTVFANDINPECYKWMNINLKKNQPKKSPREYHVWNLDGREFLQTIAFPRIEQYQNSALTDSHRQSTRKMVVLMNLPALAVTFLDVFPAWLSTDASDKAQWQIPLHIYCYTFSRGEDREGDVRSCLKTVVPDIPSDQISCRFVRQVAPNKDMMCVQIILFGRKASNPTTTVEASTDEKNETVKRFKGDSSE